MLHTALKHWPAFLGEGWGGTLILSYISRFGPFLKIAFFGVGRGREGQINKYVWEYDENFDFFMFCGVISINLALFYGQGTDLKNIFGVAKF